MRYCCLTTLELTRDEILLCSEYTDAKMSAANIRLRDEVLQTVPYTQVNGGKFVHALFAISDLNCHHVLCMYSGPSLIRIALIRNLANPKLTNN